VNALAEVQSAPFLQLAGTGTRLPVNVALAFDRAYAAHAAVVIASAVRSLHPGMARFLCLHDGVDEPCRRAVESVAPGFEFLWVEVTENDMPPMPEKGYINRISLFRLGLERFAPADWSRVIYLDSDLVVEGDLTELWQADLNGAPVGAVADVYQNGSVLQARFGLPDMQDNLYFNAGVLVLDLDALRRSRDLSACLDLLIQNDFDLEFLDQDALNVTFWNRWTRLNPAWNVQRYLRQRDPQRETWKPYQSPAIIHYITHDKPWTRNVWHPWAGAYWRVLKDTPFTEEVVARYGAGWLARLRIWLRYQASLFY
jgi:lipopolysaccharide biosynthesis glycosyltransferase